MKPICCARKNSTHATPEISGQVMCASVIISALGCFIRSCKMKYLCKYLSILLKNSTVWKLNSSLSCYFNI